LFGAKEDRSSIENPAIPLVPSTILASSGQGGNTLFGVISPQVALSCSAVFACLRVIGETTASLPLEFLEATQFGKRKATEHPYWTLLHDQPNTVMSSYIWREIVTYQRHLYGNHYSYIERNNAGVVVGLVPLNPDKVQVGIIVDKDGTQHKTFKYGDQYFDDSEILHIPNISLDGVVGISTISFARASIGLTIAAEQFGARFFSQGSSGQFWIQMPGRLEQKQIERLRETWNGNYGGVVNAHKIPILQDGAELKNVAISHDDAQFLQTRQFSIGDVARWFRVPPHKIGDLSKATFSNIEQQNIEFSSDTIRPFVVLLEQELNRKLLLPSERGRYFFAINLDGLLRGDMASRYDAYATGVQNGWLSPDDIREAENMNKRPDGLGGTYYTPLNMQPAGQAVDDPADDDTDTEPSDDSRSLDAAIEAAIEAASIPFADALSRLSRKEMEAAKRAVAKPGAFRDWQQDFYSKHQQLIAQAITPALQSLAISVASSRSKDKAKAIETANSFALILAAKLANRSRETTIETVEQKLTTWGNELAALAASEAKQLADLI